MQPQYFYILFRVSFVLSQNQRKQQIESYLRSRSISTVSSQKIYLISNKFIAQWKQYVNFENNKQTKQNIKQPILNDDLIIEDQNVILSEDLNSPYNYLSVDKLQQKTIVASSQLMNAFSNYKGKRIIRNQKKFENQLKIDFNIAKINFTIISKQTISIFINTQFPILSALISVFSTIQQMKIQITKYWIKQYYKKVNIKGDLYKQQINLWVIEQDILVEQSDKKYKNIINNSSIFGSKVTNINNVCELQNFLTNANIVFIIQIKQDNLIDFKQQCIQCGIFHHQDITCQDNITKKKALKHTSINPIGLKNLGNTCYINSALQALFHSKSLRKYFTNESFKNNINKQNIHGTGGQLVLAFEKVINDLIKGQQNDILDVLELKKVISKNNSTFKGYGQQDAQQFLMCFLDLLHEDLKMEKQFVNKQQEKDGENKNWQIYLSKQNSIITQLFGCQYSSKLHCIFCGKDRITYQPFFNFSLPIPQKQTFTKLVFCAYNRQKLYYQIELSLQNLDLKNIAKRVAKQLGQQYDPARLKFLNWKNGFREIDKLSQERFIEALIRKQIICYELAQQQLSLMKDQNCIKLTMTFRRSDSLYQIPPNRPFWFNKQVTTKDIFKRIWTWLYKSSIYQNLQPKLSKQSMATIFAVYFLKSPVLQLYIVLRPQGKKAFYYQKSIGLAVKLYQNVITTFGNTKYDIEINIDKLTQVCNTKMFGKVGRFGKQEIIEKECEEISLEECIQRFSIPQQLQQNQMQCQYCNKKQMTKTMSLSKISDYFIVHLKRFRQKLGFRFKNTRLVDFPLILDVGQFLTQKNKKLFKLYAVVNHSGTLNNGHYTSYIILQNQWYLYNDDIVSKCNQQDIFTQNAYILFYQALK